ncbi:MAG: hypothetical protein ACMUHX_12135 [bacterium]
MKRPAGWEKRFLITFIITFSISLIFMTQTTAMALFGPQIVDVTTKAFSVVWTTGGTYTSCDIVLYTGSNYSTQMTLDSSQKIIETSTGFPGEAGKQYGLAKVTVVGLSVDTTYYFRLKQNGSFLSGNYSVKTANLRGFSSTDPNNNDLVSNDIIHKAVYKSNGTSPATGALVLAYVYDYTVDPQTSPDNTKSYYPISAWVGDGMIGAGGSTYNPADISYQQYAALNLNNLFEKSTHYPLSITGDNPDTTTINESEKIKFVIVHGTQSILGGTTDTATSYGLVQYVEKSGGEKITTAKVLEGFNFKLGLNSFTFPFKPLNPIKAKDLWQLIEAAGGTVNKIYIFKTSWVPVIKVTSTYYFNGDITIGEGEASIILMDKAMNANQELTFYGNPLSRVVTLKNGVNIFSIPQCPAYYQTKNLWLDLEALDGVSKVMSVYTFLNPWAPTVKVTSSYFYNSLDMISSRVYAVILELDSGVASVNWEPFP